MKSIEHAIVMNGAYAAGAMGQTLPKKWMTEERLPFTVRIVRSNADLHRAVAIRQAAFARHVPEFAEKLKTPEAEDRADGSVVLLAESRLDGSPLGTMRIQTNRFNKLVIEQSVDLPARVRGSSLAQATRLANDGSRMGPLVKTVLFKAFYMYCVETGVEWMVATARPPLDRQYKALLFEDLYPGELIPMHHANNIPNCVLALNVQSTEPSWVKFNHKLYNFMFRTHHPDLDLSDSDTSPLGGYMRATEMHDGVSVAA
jgi:hypothetical protein